MDCPDDAVTAVVIEGRSVRAGAGENSLNVSKKP
jgi:hypothetical protein